MAVVELIEKLEKATEANRRLDFGIAIEIGYECKDVMEVMDRDSGTNTAVRRWFDPAGKRVSHVPFFTNSIEDAFNLATSVFPDTEIGVALVDKKNSTAVVSKTYGHGAAPPIALCVAVLRSIDNKKN